MPDETGQGEVILAAVRKDPSNPDTWNQFYTFYRRHVAVVLFLLGVRTDAADLIQEVFARFLESSPWRENWSSLPDASVVGAYLRQTAKNVAFDQFRKDARTKATAVGSSVELDRFPGPLLDRADTEDDLRTLRRPMLERLAQTLKPQDRALLRHLLQGSALHTIAFDLDISYGAAAVRVTRLKDRLRRLARGLP